MADARSKVGRMRGARQGEWARLDRALARGKAGKMREARQG
jgi:hypothetical protein